MDNPLQNFWYSDASPHMEKVLILYNIDKPKSN